MVLNNFQMDEEEFPVQEMEPEELVKLLESDPGSIEVVDVREPHELDIIKLKGARSLPISQLEDRLNEIDWDKKIIFFCRTGPRSKSIASQFAEDYDVYNLRGGIDLLYDQGFTDVLEIGNEKELQKYL